jgi:hypothetical protein
MDHRPDLVDEGGQIRVVKIYHHHHFIPRATGVFRGPAFTIDIGSHPSKHGLKIRHAMTRRTIGVVIPPGTDGHLQKAGFGIFGRIPVQ